MSLELIYLGQSKGYSCLEFLWFHGKDVHNIHTVWEAASLIEGIDPRLGVKIIKEINPGLDEDYTLVDGDRILIPDPDGNKLIMNQKEGNMRIIDLSEDSKTSNTEN